MSGHMGQKSSHDKCGGRATGCASSNTTRRPSLPMHGAFLDLQRSAGNQAISNLFEGATGEETDDSRSNTPPIVDEVLNGGGGQPMDGGTRSFLEQRFGQNFGGVRIHADESAASSTEALGAAAYTSGEDIVFGSGRYAPSTNAGMHLLAHELAHVVQQRGASGATTAGVNLPSDSFEVEADNAASQVSNAFYGGLEGPAATVSLATPGAHGAPAAVQCQTLTDAPEEHRALTPNRRHRKPIPDEARVEMIRQIIAIRDRWAGRVLPVKGSDVELVVNLVFEYAEKGSDASRGGHGSPSDWVDTFIEIMASTVYDRGVVFADYANLWDDVLQNASRSQWAEINNYLSRVDSQYVSYKPPDPSKDPSFFDEVVTPVASRALELVSLGIVDVELLKDLKIAATERDIPKATNALKEAGLLLAQRISGALTFGGAPSAYKRVADYLDAHPEGDKSDRILMAIAEGGEGFAEGLLNTILPLQEAETLGRDDRNFWQKMEAFFSALLKVVTLGEMTKRGGGRGGRREPGSSEGTGTGKTTEIEPQGKSVRETPRQAERSRTSERAETGEPPVRQTEQGEGEITPELEENIQGGIPLNEPELPASAPVEGVDRFGQTEPEMTPELKQNIQRGISLNEPELPTSAPVEGTEAPERVGDVTTRRPSGFEATREQRKLPTRAGEFRESSKFEPTIPKPRPGEKLVTAKAPSRRAQLEGLKLDDNAARKLLNKHLGAPPGASQDWQAHHAIPYEFRTHPVVEEATLDAGWDINGKNNGIHLPTDSSVPGAGSKAIHNQNHPQYNAMVEDRLNEIQKANGSPSEKRAALEVLSNELKTKLDTGQITLN